MTRMRMPVRRWAKRAVGELAAQNFAAFFEGDDGDGA